jgi:hypothetical protein
MNRLMPDLTGQLAVQFEILLAARVSSVPLGDSIMPRPLRTEIYNPLEISVLPAVHRCVRRAYLAVADSVNRCLRLPAIEV